MTARYLVSLFVPLTLATSLPACGDSTSSTASSPASGQPAPVASTTSSATAAATAAPAKPAATMSVAQFCTALHDKVEALANKCTEKPETADMLKILKLNLADDSCTRMENVEILADKVPACLAEVRTSWVSTLAVLQGEPACRGAFAGKTAIGATCKWDLECPSGSYCVTKPDGTDSLEMACSPVIVAGTPCKEKVGDTCGKDFYCDKGKCAERPKAGGACTPTTQHCARGLTCLIDKSGAKEGKCGPRLKAGQACHRWTECEGACVSKSKATQDGTCESFCGSE